MEGVVSAESIGRQHGEETGEKMKENGLKPLAQRLGKWAALAQFGLTLIYAVVLGIGLSLLQTSTEPIRDPYLSAMEIIILLMAPVLILLMASVHTYAAQEHKVLSMTALVLMGICAGLTSCVHFSVLTFTHMSGALAESEWFSFFFSWNWPSVVYVVDILAWDFFFGLSVILAAPIFRGDKPCTSVRRLLLVSGFLSLIGLLGPITGNMAIRMIGVVGYVGVFPWACLLMARVFSRPYSSES